MRIQAIAFAGALIFALAACGEEDEHEHGEHAGAHAPAGAEPGTHEDWCGAHEVPESQCTRCNPSLVAAFQATGDWCAEHNLPESQCKLCNPDLVIERPAKRSGSSP